MVGMDCIPRQLSRAQTFDSLSSMANIAGYRCAEQGGVSGEGILRGAKGLLQRGAGWLGMSLEGRDPKIHIRVLTSSLFYNPHCMHTLPTQGCH